MMNRKRRPKSIRNFHFPAVREQRRGREGERLMGKGHERVPGEEGKRFGEGKLLEKRRSGRLGKEEKV